MQFHGKVTRQPLNTGSKSEHPGVVLLTEDGPLKLRRPGGNPFSDPELDRLVGLDIDCDGEIQHGQLILGQWRVTRRQRR